MPGHPIKNSKISWKIHQSPLIKCTHIMMSLSHERDQNESDVRWISISDTTTNNRYTSFIIQPAAMQHSKYSWKIRQETSRGLRIISHSTIVWLTVFQRLNYPAITFVWKLNIAGLLLHTFCIHLKSLEPKSMTFIFSTNFTVNPTVDCTQQRPAMVPIHQHVQHS